MAFVRRVIGDGRGLRLQPQVLAADAEGMGLGVPGRDMDARAGGPAEIDRMTEGGIACRHHRPARPREPLRVGGQDAEQHPQGRADANAARAVDRVDRHVEGAAFVQQDDVQGFLGQDLAHARRTQGGDHVVVGRDVQRLLPVAAVIGADDGLGVAMQAPRRQPRGQRRQRARDGRHDGRRALARQHIVQQRPRRGPVRRQAQHQRPAYFAPTASMASTLPADLPLRSKFWVCASHASAMVLATSAPMTRAPMVMICASFDRAARSAE